MKSSKDVKLESTIHSMLCRTVKQALQDFSEDDRDAEDGIWPALSDHLQAVAMMICEVKREN